MDFATAKLVNFRLTAKHFVKNIKTPYIRAAFLIRYWIGFVIFAVYFEKNLIKSE